MNSFFNGERETDAASHRGCHMTLAEYFEVVIIMQVLEKHQEAVRGMVNKKILTLINDEFV